MPSPGKKMENGNSAWNQMVHPIPFRGKFQSLKAMLLLQCQIQVLGWGWGEGGGDPPLCYALFSLIRLQIRLQLILINFVAGPPLRLIVQ